MVLKPVGFEFGEFEELAQKFGSAPVLEVISLGNKCLLWVCAVTRRRFPVGASPTRQPLQPEATGAVMEVTKWLKRSSFLFWRAGELNAASNCSGRH